MKDAKCKVLYCAACFYIKHLYPKSMQFAMVKKIIIPLSPCILVLALLFHDLSSYHLHVDFEHDLYSGFLLSPPLLKHWSASYANIRIIQMPFRWISRSSNCVISTGIDRFETNSDIRLDQSDSFPQISDSDVSKIFDWRF